MMRNKEIAFKKALQEIFFGGAKKCSFNLC